MRSRTDYIMTKEEVYGYAENWLSTALRLGYEGRKCTTSVLFRILLIAAGRVVSLFAACRGHFSITLWKLAFTKSADNAFLRAWLGRPRY